MTEHSDEYNGVNLKEATNDFFNKKHSLTASGLNASFSATPLSSSFLYYHNDPQYLILCCGSFVFQKRGVYSANIIK